MLVVASKVMLITSDCSKVAAGSAVLLRGRREGQDWCGQNQRMPAQGRVAIAVVMKSTYRVLQTLTMNLNHLFQNAKTGAFTEYALIEETFDISTLELISSWILKTVGD